KEDVERVYKLRMLNVRGHAELSTYEERLEKVLSIGILPLALELLTEAAVTGKLTPDAAMIICRDFDLKEKKPEAALRDIINILEHDGYLVRKKNGYVYDSNLVRDWWKARFGFYHRPACEREKAI
ncbi:MAG: ATP-binding protein, partial [bacterium]|nr:ATP-binding protein [bacterium]